MKFRIIEGQTDTGLYEKYIELYNQGIPVMEIRQRLSITGRKMKVFREKAVKEGRIIARGHTNTRPQKPVPDALHYCKYLYGFQIKYRGIYYCCCKTEEQAKQIVSKLKECNWDKSKANEIKQEVMA